MFYNLAELGGLPSEVCIIVKIRRKRQKLVFIFLRYSAVLSEFISGT